MSNPAALLVPSLPTSLKSVRKWTNIDPLNLRTRHMLIGIDKRCVPNQETPLTQMEEIRLTSLRI